MACGQRAVYVSRGGVVSFRRSMLAYTGPVNPRRMVRTDSPAEAASGRGAQLAVCGTKGIARSMSTADSDTASPGEDGSRARLPIGDGGEAHRGTDKTADRKAAKKQAKMERRAKREGRLVTTKPCELCARQVTLLVRCQTDATRAWRMVCGKCWHVVSGGVTDGSPNHPHYRYGGLWKAQ